MSAQPDDLDREFQELLTPPTSHASEPIGWGPLAFAALALLLGFCIIGLAFDVAVHLLALALGAL